MRWGPPLRTTSLFPTVQIIFFYLTIGHSLLTYLPCPSILGILCGFFLLIYTLLTQDAVMDKHHISCLHSTYIPMKHIICTETKSPCNFWDFSASELSPKEINSLILSETSILKALSFKKKEQNAKIHKLKILSNCINSSASQSFQSFTSPWH